MKIYLAKENCRKKNRKERLHSLDGMCKRHCNLPKAHVGEKITHSMDNSQRKDRYKLEKK